MSEFKADDLTAMLCGASDLDTSSANQLFQVVYGPLRSIAHQRMTMEIPGHTLQATALVHEAYLRLLGGEAVAWNNRAHFFRAAAQAMRRILIDHARSKN